MTYELVLDNARMQANCFEHEPDDWEGWFTLGVPAVQVVAKSEFINNDPVHFPGEFLSPYASIVSYSSHNITYGMSPAFGTPFPLWSHTETWQCAYQHANSGIRQDSQMWNNPLDDITWNGEGVCKSPDSPAHTHGATDGAPIVAWKSYAGGGGDLIAGYTLAAYHINKTNLLSFGPDKYTWYTPPTPPPGFTLVWESSVAELLSIELGMDEETAGTGSADIMVWGGPGTIGQDGSGSWHFGSRPGGSAIFSGYNGGATGWSEISLPSGISHWIGVPTYYSQNTYPPFQMSAGTTEEVRRPQPVFRLTWKPSRYKFVEI